MVRQNIKNKRRQLTEDEDIPIANLDLGSSSSSGGKINYLQLLDLPNLNWDESPELAQALLIYKLEDEPGFRKFIASLDPGHRLTLADMWSAPTLDQLHQHEMAEIEETLFKNDIVEEGMYTCNRCQCSKTRVKSKQTRSADEGETTFVRCLGCRHTWTIAG